MTSIKTEAKIHPAESELADFLANSLPAKDRKLIESHIADCSECMTRTVSAYESVKLFRKSSKPGKGKFMKKINVYLIFAILSFMLSFIMPAHFIQLLVATLLLGTKWIVDSKTTRMLVMIYEAWKNGGEKEASRILDTLQSKNSRF